MRPLQEVSKEYSNSTFQPKQKNVGIMNFGKTTETLRFNRNNRRFNERSYFSFDFVSSIWNDRTVKSLMKEKVDCGIVIVDIYDNSRIAFISKEEINV